MAVVRINAKSGGAAFTVQPEGAGTPTDYTSLLDTIRLRELTGMDPSATFSTEGTNDQEPMSSQIVFEMGGLNTRGGAASGPLIPAPQNAAIKATYSAGCFFTFNANFTEAWADRLVNQQSRIGARGLSKGAYVKTWDVGP